MRNLLLTGLAAICLFGCVPGQLAFSAPPPMRPALDPRFSVSVTAPDRSDEFSRSAPSAEPLRNSDCDCQDKGEADDCACEKCECKLCIGKVTDIDEGTGETSVASVSFGVPIQTIASTPPRPSVEPAPSSLQNGDEAAIPNINEAYRRLKAAGYEWREVEECELCDTCPSGFKYTGRSVFTAYKNYDEGQTVGASDPTSPQPTLPTSSPIVSASSGWVSSSPYRSTSRSFMATPGVYAVTEASCGSESYSAPMTYQYEASCGSEGYSAAPYYAAPIVRGGFFQRLRARFQSPRASVSRTYSGYSTPYYSNGFGSCLTGNCG